MSIENRRTSSNRYLTNSIRVNGRIVRQYIGCESDAGIQIVTRRKGVRDAILEQSRQATLADIERSRKIQAILAGLIGAGSRWSTLAALVHPTTRHRNLKRFIRLNVQFGSAGFGSKEFADLPSKKEFDCLCRAALTGDEPSEYELWTLTENGPQIFSDASSLLKAAEDLLVESLAGKCEATGATIRARIEQTNYRVREGSDGSELDRLFAGVVVMSYMDTLRCGASGMRPTADNKTAKYWDSAHDRAIKRWLRVSKSYERFVRQQSRKQKISRSTTSEQ